MHYKNAIYRERHICLPSVTTLCCWQQFIPHSGSVIAYMLCLDYQGSEESLMTTHTLSLMCLSCVQGLCVPGRVSVAWFKPHTPDLYHHSRFPVWILHDADQNVPFYGFPEFGKQAGQSAVVHASVSACVVTSVANFGSQMSCTPFLLSLWSLVAVSCNTVTMTAVFAPNAC